MAGASSSTYAPPWLQLEFGERLAWSKGHVISLVPDVFFDGALAKDYLKQTGAPRPKHTRFSHLEALGCYIVYEEKAMTQGHSFGHLIDHLACTVLPFNPSFLHFHLDVDCLFLATFSNGKLFLANSFRFNTKEDILYYLVAVAEQSGIKLSEHRVSYSGFLRPTSALKRMLMEYIPDVVPIDLSIHHITFPPPITPDLQHMYADMFILPLCGL
ncbi:MAG: DUF3822 family protein [Bacteroidetes bacterium]|nr:DUF3822 family protein [Bacteroidota bacterium]